MFAVVLGGMTRAFIYLYLIIVNDFRYLLKACEVVENICLLIDLEVYIDPKMSIVDDLFGDQNRIIF